MRKKLTVWFTEGEPDMLGNYGNVKTSVALVGEEECVIMTFGGRDGSSDTAITLDQLRRIFDEIGIEE